MSAGREIDARQAFMILGALSDWGPISARKALAWAGGDPNRLLGEKSEALAAVVGKRRAESLRDWPTRFDLERTEARLEEMGARFVIETDEAYPSRLKQLPDAPLGLYWQGVESLPVPAIAIVGTRSTTSYGRRVTESFTRALVRAGFSIISGLALGVDAEAHRAALEAGGVTAAILGHGLEQSYPPQNRELFARMRVEGAVMSEFPFGRRPDRQSFPQRNRLVSGISVATLVVETARRGGSLITAKFAMEQNRTVFAIPGRIDQPQSLGCLDLVRDGATLVTSPEEIIDELKFMQLDLDLPLGSGEVPVEDRFEEELAGLEGDEREILAALRDGDALHMDQLCEGTSLPPFRVQAGLMMLELQRLVVRVPGGAFERNV